MLASRAIFVMPGRPCKMQFRFLESCIMQCHTFPSLRYLIDFKLIFFNKSFA